MTKRKIISVLLIVVVLFSICSIAASCTDKKENDNLVWDNDNAVYAYVKAGYQDDILNNVEKAFESLHFKKIYVAEKNASQFAPLALLFVLEENVTANNKQEFVNLLKQDERLYSVRECRDLQFETVDNRYFEKEKDTIAVGETISLTLKGESPNVYIQPFDFGGLLVKSKTNKKYTVKSFNGIDLKSVQQRDNGWLYLELTEENYFNVIKASNILSRLPTMEYVSHDTSNIFLTPPPSWQVSDPTIVSLTTDDNNYDTVLITGLKSGKVTVEFAGLKSIYCEITVK